MKFILFAIVSVSIFLGGCATTYRMSDFSDKEKYYEDINNNLKKRETFILFRNDSLLTAHTGVEITNDTLFSTSRSTTKNLQHLPLSDFADLTFAENNAASALITLKNGKTIAGIEIHVVKDSITFFEIQNVLTRKKIAEVANVKQISFHDKMKRVGQWSVGGMLLGGVIGLASVKSYSTAHWESQEIMKFPFGATLGFLIGGLFGYLVDNNFTYLIK